MGRSIPRCHNCGKPFVCVFNKEFERFEYCCHAPLAESLMIHKSPVIIDHASPKRNKYIINPEFLELAKKQLFSNKEQK